MKRALFLSVALMVPALSIFACSGAVLPVAQDNGDSGASGGSSGASGSSGSSGGSSTSSSGGSGSSSGSTTSSASSSGSSGGNCPADAGGNNCFCGDLICQNGAWVCGPCTNDGGGQTTCEPPCNTGDVCVRDQVVGGAVIPPDGGVCPPGRHPNAAGDRCELDPTFTCIKSPDTCNGTPLTCACAGSLCTQQQSCPYQCDSTSPGQVNCVCPVP